MKSDLFSSLYKSSTDDLAQGSLRLLRENSTFTYQVKFATTHDGTIN